jgi:hypothetical protein
MCLKTPKATAPQAPMAPPPLPKPVEFGSEATKYKKRSSARADLAVPLNMGGTSGSTGLGIPR